MSKKRPDIIVILSDQLRRHALGCYGDPNSETPNLDALASGGVRFEAACSTYPICVPFRFTLMTGHYGHSRLIPGIEWRMSPAERTLGDELRENGYEGVYIGKWHLWGGHGQSTFKRPVPREHRGRWEKWFGFEFRNSHFDTCYFEDDDPEPIEIDGYQTDGLFDRAIDYMGARDDDRPALCVISVEAPHPPYEAPEPFMEKWRDRDIETPPEFMRPAVWDEDTNADTSSDEKRRDQFLEIRRTYYAMVENLDWNTGRLMQSIEERGAADDTIVVVMSDHGDLCGGHALRGKQYPYEESVGIPLIVHGPGCGVEAGRVVEAPTCTEDLFPTLLGLAGVTPKETMYGSDLSPVVRGEADGPDRAGVMLEFVAELRPPMPFYNGAWRAWRERRYKYTVLRTGLGLQPWQFFDLEEDPHELNNLVDDPACADRIRECHLRLRERMVETGDHEWLVEAWGVDALNEWVVK